MIRDGLLRFWLKADFKARAQNTSSAHHFPHQTMKSDFSIYLWISFWARAGSSLGTFFSFKEVVIAGYWNTFLSGGEHLVNFPYFPFFPHFSAFIIYHFYNSVQDKRQQVKERNPHVLPSCEIFWFLSSLTPLFWGIYVTDRRTDPWYLLGFWGEVLEPCVYLKLGS